ncbi:MAG: CopG family transcriptional regulator [Spirochaetaceae bacterium]|nr:CopG family transcriptional regulator [Spirochaetaceae bacterium]
MVTIRLPDEIESQLEIMTVLEHKTKTEIIKSALSEYIEKRLPAKSAYELGKEFFGRHSSDTEDLSVTFKERLKIKLYEKHSH